MSRATRLRLIALTAVTAGHLALSMLTPVPGYLSVDEATFHMMVKNFAERGDLEIWNGYREFPSPELASASISIHSGRLVGQPPYLHPALGAPFYLLWGYRGMFALNALAFALAVGVTFLIARRLLGDLDQALDACLILVLATFAWEYSQAAWTHATALLFNVAAFYAAVRALIAGRGRSALRFALAAGLAAGFGAGIRLDSVFVLACLLLPFFFARPWRPAAAAAYLVGTLPGLIVLSATSVAKFGSPLPFMTGRGGSDPIGELRRYLSFLALVAVTALAVWAVSRMNLDRLVADHRRRLAAVAALLAIVLLLVPSTRRLVWRQVTGTATIVGDLRFKPVGEEERAMIRSPGRAVMYIGGVKKSLLQSLPYLPLLVLPAVVVARRRRGYRRLGLLLLVPVAYTGFYSQFSWHGGLGLNMRYLVQILPYTSILAAWALRDLSRRLAVPWRRVALPAVLAAVVVFWLARTFFRSWGLVELQYLNLPLMLTAALTLLLVAALRRPRRSDLAAAIGALTLGALLWAGQVALFYDYPLARRARRYNLVTGQRTAALVAPDSIFFANALDKFFLLIESNRVRIARPTMDDFRDLPRLVAF
ncbi:MAG: hypothetical protein ACE5EG_07910, partial [Thermoanaerobaculia bacterium]